MECPYCGGNLQDLGAYYQGRPGNFYGTSSNGIYYPPTPDYKILGRQYRCNNEECEAFESFFYTKNGELLEGNPC